MDPEYLEQFKNDNIERLFLEGGKNLRPVIRFFGSGLVGVLEKIDENDLDFGPIPKRKDLSTLLEEIKPEVDNLLGVKDIDICKINYEGHSFGDIFSLSVGNITSGMSLYYATNFGFSHSEYALFGTTMLLSLLYSGMNLLQIRAKKDMDGFYSIRSERIFVKKRPRNKLIPILAHEYTHHVQNKMGLKGRNLDYFKEGQASAVERPIANHFASEEKNSVFIYENLIDTITSLMNIDYWLTADETEREEIKESFHFKYDIGKTFFLLKELQEEDIHKRIMNGTYQLSPFQL